MIAPTEEGHETLDIRFEVVWMKACTSRVDHEHPGQHHEDQIGLPRDHRQATSA